MMKHLAVLSFIIALLSVPIQAQAQQSLPPLAAPFHVDRQSPDVEQLRAAQQYQQYLAQQQYLAAQRYQQYLAQQQYLAAQRYQQYLAAQPVTNCVRFPQNADPEAEVRYLTSHPNSHVCPSDNPDLAGQAATVQNGMRQQAIDHGRLMDAMSGRGY
jgi:hypothetical protein